MTIYWTAVPKAEILLIRIGWLVMASSVLIDQVAWFR